MEPIIPLVFEAPAKDAEPLTTRPGETFWAERVATITDRFGTPWMLDDAGAKAGAATEMVP
jgi:PhnB protein